MEYKAGREYKMKYIDKDQKEHKATYTPDKDTNIAGMINGFKDKTKDFFKLLSIDNKSLDESRKITEEKDFGLKDALDNDVELFDDIYLYLDEYIEDEDTKSEIEDIIDKYTGIDGSAEDLDEDSEDYKSELKDCINEIEDLLNLNESKKITEEKINDFFFNQGLEKAKEVDKVKNLKLINQAAHSFNDEDLIDVWLTNGVPDGATEEDFEEIVNDTDSTYGTDYSSMIKLFTNLVKKAVEDKDSKYTFFECPEEAFNFVKNSINNNVTNVTRKELIGEGEELDKTKLEDRLASLKTQLEVDGDQLADDEKESIEKEIADLEAKVYPKDLKEDNNIQIPKVKVEVDKDGNKSIRDKKTGHLKKITVSKKTQDKMSDKYNKKQELNESKKSGYIIFIKDDPNGYSYQGHGGRSRVRLDMTDALDVYDTVEQAQKEVNTYKNPKKIKIMKFDGKNTTELNENNNKMSYGDDLEESKKITESEDKPELADMLIEINRYYIDYIDNISFFIDLANVAGIDYNKVYNWYKSIKEDENDDLEESKKLQSQEIE